MQKTLLLNLLRKNKKAVFIASLGTICHDIEEAVKEVPDFKGEIYFIRGAMGCAMSIGLGYALNSKKKVIVIVGDGALMMKAGSMITINGYKPKNLFVHIMNNGIYASTGGQKINFIKHDEAQEALDYFHHHQFVHHI